ncbi:hypothetical protein NKI98_31235 [Mesorhizobium sp. M0222]|uniref:hypothetical protein n=1 Tax=Mesorhizobium sp. M0222 TaxID=2956921 RepID=UPI003334E072
MSDHVVTLSNPIAGKAQYGILVYLRPRNASSAADMVASCPSQDEFIDSSWLAPPAVLVVERFFRLPDTRRKPIEAATPRPRPIGATSMPRRPLDRHRSLRIPINPAILSK